MSDTKMKVLDLFSGIGGFSLGLERAGMETVAFCEIEKFPQDVLKKHWPETPLFPDVKLLNAKMLPEKIDLICGGFPCQDISVAGKKKGLIDESGNTTRSGLWFEFKRLIQEIKPKYVIIENVANLRSNGLSEVIQDLWQIGYVGEWHIISARSVGACHLRERCWIIAYPKNVRRDRRSLLIRESPNNGPGKDSTEGNGQTQPMAQSAKIGNTTCIGMEGLWPDRQQVIQPHAGEGLSVRPSEDTPNTNNIRLWKPFATEEAKQQWWAEATFGFSDVFGKIYETEPTVCRSDDGVSRGLDKIRSKRIKALGNTIVPQIAEVIGRLIINYENGVTNESK